MPVVLYQVWLFIAPGLYQHERRAVSLFIFSSMFLFLAGVAFGYFISLPYVLKFLIGFQGPFKPLISINEYFDMILIVLLGLGIIFELPVLIFCLTLFGIVTPGFLWKNFRYAILVITILAAVVTPTPDATTMVIFMGVMTLLYVLGDWRFVFGGAQTAAGGSGWLMPAFEIADGEGKIRRMRRRTVALTMSVGAGFLAIFLFACGNGAPKESGLGAAPLRSPLASAAAPAPASDALPADKTGGFDGAQGLRSCGENCGDRAASAGFGRDSSRTGLHSRAIEGIWLHCSRMMIFTLRLPSARLR